MFIHLSQIEKFYKDRSVKISNQTPSKVSIDEVVSVKMQNTISELAHDIESAVDKGDLDKESKKILDIVQLLQTDETSSIYGYDLCETVVNNTEFFDSLPFANRYALRLASAQCGQEFFNSADIAHLDVGTRLVQNAYKRAGQCAKHEKEDDSKAKSGYESVMRNVANAKIVHSEEVRQRQAAHKEMAEVIKEARKTFK